MALDPQCVDALNKAFKAAKKGETTTGDVGGIFFVITPRKANVTLSPAAKANRLLEWIEYLQDRSKNGKVMGEFNKNLGDALLTFPPKL